MMWQLDVIPDDFSGIGTFRGKSTEKHDELTSTALFHEKEIINHYVDKEGLHYFYVKTARNNTYVGIYKAKINRNDQIVVDPHIVPY